LYLPGGKTPDMNARTFAKVMVGQQLDKEKVSIYFKENLV